MEVLDSHATLAALPKHLSKHLPSTILAAQQLSPTDYLLANQVQGTTALLHGLQRRKRSCPEKGKKRSTILNNQPNLDVMGHLQSAA